MLVVGGRLSNSQLALSQKHPPILASKNVLTQLMFRSLHVSLCHCGPSLLLSHAGSRAHVLGARPLARKVCRSCVVCRKVAAKLETQQMGQLPRARVIPSPAFDKTGIDFAGPFLMKKGHTRRPVVVKTYLCVFVCFCTRAVHLEVVSDLTTEAFLACLKRFVSQDEDCHLKFTQTMDQILREHATICLISINSCKRMPLRTKSVLPCCLKE